MKFDVQSQGPVQLGYQSSLSTAVWTLVVIVSIFLIVCVPLGVFLLSGNPLRGIL